MRAIENVSLVKEQSTPAVYLIVGHTKFWIGEPAEFNALGFDSSKVRVVDDGTLSSFTQKLLRATPATRPSDVFFDCGKDYSAIDGDHKWNCKSSTSLVRKDVLVAGWLVNPINWPDVPHVNVPGDPSTGVEDIHYELLLDAVFLDRMYGPDGLSKALRGAIWPGNPPAPAGDTIGFEYWVPAPQSGRLLHADFNSWILPGGWNGLHCELNSWHTRTSGSFGHDHIEGRGPHPAGWVNPLPQDPDAWFPFDPRDPEGSGWPLRLGEYLVMRGSLWQDIGHDPAGTTSSVWTLNYDGWGEIHPPDWIVRSVLPDRTRG